MFIFDVRVCVCVCVCVCVRVSIGPTTGTRKTDTEWAEINRNCKLLPARLYSLLALSALHLHLAVCYTMP
jgi:hypothetical protein